MRAGSLRNKISIQMLTSSRDSFGEEIYAWSDFKVVNALILPISGKESFLSNQSFATVSHKIRVRYISGVVPSMRILFDSREFNIISSINIGERNKELEILAVENIDVWYKCKRLKWCFKGS